MPHLLDKIVDAATEAEMNLPHLLRLCKVLASQLSNTELAEWADQELKGYPSGVGLPAYRVFPSICQMRIRNAMVGERTIDIPEVAIKAVAPDHVETLTVVRCRQSVAEVSDLRAAYERSGVAPKVPWPLEVTRMVAVQVTGWEALSAWTAVPSSRLVGLLDAVQNRVLDLALALRKEHPELGTLPSEKLPDVSKEKVQQVVHNTIHVTGDNARIDASVANVDMQTGDLASLKTALAAAGLAPDEVEQTTAIVQQEESPKGVMQKLLALPGALGVKALETGVIEAVKTYFP